MKKLNKLIITEMLLDEVLCTVCAVIRDQKVVELRLEPSGKKNTLNNIYVGQVENIAANIQAAFVRLSDSTESVHKRHLRRRTQVRPAPAPG